MINRNFGEKMEEEYKKIQNFDVVMEHLKRQGWKSPTQIEELRHKEIDHIKDDLISKICKYFKATGSNSMILAIHYDIHQIIEDTLWEYR